MKRGASLAKVAVTWMPSGVMERRNGLVPLNVMLMRPSMKPSALKVRRLRGGFGGE